MNEQTAELQAAPVAVETLKASMRRFELADLSRHGGWLMQRMIQFYPHMTDREMMGFLRGILMVSEFLFLYQEHGVALFQIMRTHSMLPKPIVHERFVFIENKENKDQQIAAAEFYKEAARWAKMQGAEVILVCEVTDVPRGMIQEKLKKLSTVEQVFARV